MYVTSTLPGGNYSITVQYSGDSNFSGSTLTALTQAVDPIASQTALQSSENPSNYGDSVTFTATVSPTSSASGIATPTGEVEFFDGSTLLGTETLSGGTASYTTSSLSVGANQPIEAEYLGDSDYSPSNLTIQQTINAPTTIMWNTTTAPTGGDWDTPGNWVGGVVPTASNNVVINLTSSGTVTHSTGANDAALSLTTNGNTALSIGSGSIALGTGSSTLASVTIGTGATLSVAAGASVTIQAAQTFTDDGTLTFGSGDSVSFPAAQFATTQLVVNSGGVVNAASTSFSTPGNASGSLTQIVVNSGGELIAASSTFGVNQLVLANGSVLNPGDLTNDVFNLPIYVPALDVPLLTNNQSFGAININGGSLSAGQSLTLGPIGTK